MEHNYSTPTTRCDILNTIGDEGAWRPILRIMDSSIQPIRVVATRKDEYVNRMSALERSERIVDDQVDQVFKHYTYINEISYKYNTVSPIAATYNITSYLPFHKRFLHCTSISGHLPSTKIWINQFPSNIYPLNSQSKGLRRYHHDTRNYYRKWRSRILW